MNRNVVDGRWRSSWHDAIVDAVEAIDWDIVEVRWELTRGKIKERWGKLNDDQLDEIGGKRHQLVNAIQETYAVSEDEAARQVRDWETRNGEWFEKIAHRVRNHSAALQH